MPLLQVINNGAACALTPSATPLASRPSAMELVTPIYGKRSLWCELPEVMQSGLLGEWGD